MIKKRFFCIKEVIVDLDSGDLYKNYFKLNKGYDFTISIDEDEYYNHIHTNDFSLCEFEIKEFFIPLSEWREQQINKILDD
jgi:hypothetical protein